MTIKDVIRQKGEKVYSLQTGETLREALANMTAHRIGALLIMDRNREIAGILSERDILRHLDNGGGILGKATVEEVMTPRHRLVVVAEDDDLDYAMGIMTRNRVRHLPVVAAGKLCGMVSIGDLIKAQLSCREHENKMLQDYIAGRYPA